MQRFKRLFGAKLGSVLQIRKMRSVLLKRQREHSDIDISVKEFDRNRPAKTLTSPLNLSPTSQHRALTSRDTRPKHMPTAYSQIPRAAMTSRQNMHHMAIAQQVAQQQRLRHHNTPSPTPLLPSWITSHDRAPTHLLDTATPFHHQSST